MNLAIIIAIVIIVVLVLKFKGKELLGGDPADNTSRPNANEKPTTEKDNDKLIVVSNVNHDNIRLTLSKFCNIYNKESYAALPRLWEVNPGTYVVTFPYDIDFVTFCFAVNFMQYPVDVKWDAKVLAWTTATKGEAWIADTNVGKRIMLFVPEDDKEYDNVFFTTDDNIGYKLGFAARKAKPPLDMPKMQFTGPTIDLNSLKALSFEDIA